MNLLTLGILDAHAPQPTSGASVSADPASTSAGVRRRPQAAPDDRRDGRTLRRAGLRGDQDRRRRPPRPRRPQDALRQLLRQGGTLPRRLRHDRRRRRRRGRRGLRVDRPPPSGRRAPKPACGRCSSSSPPTRRRRGSAWSRRPPRAPPRRPATTRRVDGFIARLREAAPPGPGRPATLEEALVGGTVWIVQRQVRRGGAEDAVDLLPELTRVRYFSVPGCRKKVSDHPGANVTVRCHNSMIRWIACRVAVMACHPSSSRAISAID